MWERFVNAIQGRIQELERGGAEVSMRAEIARENFHAHSGVFGYTVRLRTSMPIMGRGKLEEPYLTVF